MSMLRIVSCCIFGCAVACSSVPDGSEEAMADVAEGDGMAATPAAASELGMVEQAITGTQKVCSAVVPGQFRDTLVVPDGWGLSSCFLFAQTVNAELTVAGCLTEAGVVFATRAGELRFGNESGIPSPNCGW